MKKLLIALSFLLSIPLLSHAQFGLNLGYNQITASNWDEYLRLNQSNLGNSDEAFLNNGIEVGLDYWFRLKEKRIEFFPAITYAQFKNNWQANFPTRVKHSSISLQLNTHIYLFDFGGDCNCPTFSKDGNTLKKGFFIKLFPGISYLKNTIEGTNTSNSSTSEISPYVGAGVGLDLGFADFITVTPMISYSHYFDATWENLGLYTDDNNNVTIQEDVSSPINRLYFGVRLGLRFDEMNKFGYR